MRLLFCLILGLILSPTTFAVDMGSIFQVQNKTVPLYTNPDASSKIVMNVSQGQNFITIYQQKDWIKVADPQTGNVGWIKESDFNQMTTQVGPVIQHYVINQKDANGKNQQYVVTEVTSGSQRMSDQDAQKFIAQAQESQQQMQNDMNNMMSDMMRNINDMQKVFWHYFPSFYIVQQGDNSLVNQNGASVNFISNQNKALGNVPANPTSITQQNK